MSAFQPLLGLELEPTPAMLRGEQRAFQCSWCGTVVVQSGLAAGLLSACPACGCTTWWRQELPLAGLRMPGGAA